MTVYSINRGIIDEVFTKYNFNSLHFYVSEDCHGNEIEKKNKGISKYGESYRNW